VAGIVGFGAAAKILGDEKEKTAAAEHVRKLREYFLKELARLAPKMRLNGSPDGSSHIANIWLPGKPADFMLLALDRLGVAISSGSACRSRSLQLSYVLQAMGLPEKRIKESLRVSFGRTTTKEEVQRAIKAFKKALSSK
jgi:cysteine desulfurase